MSNEKFDMARVNNFFEHDYQDRGVLKWQGFYLSDHTAALNRQSANDRLKYSVKSQQSLSEIGVLLATAFQQHQQVSLQLNIVDKNMQRIPDLLTDIIGYNEESVILTNQQSININQIRHIELITDGNSVLDKQSQDD